MDFEGTACATQFCTGSVEQAFQLWLADLDLVGIYGLTDEQRARLLQAVAESRWQIKKLQEMQNTWWVSITPDDGSMVLLHVVETAILGGPPPGWSHPPEPPADLELEPPPDFDPSAEFELPLIDIESLPGGIQPPPAKPEPPPAKPEPPPPDDQKS